MTSKQFREKIHSHLHKAEIEEALNLLISSLDGSRQLRDHDNALMLKAKWEGIKQEQLRGVISRQEYELAISKVIAGIQTVTNEVDKIGEKSIDQKNASSRSFNRIFIAAGIVCLIGVAGWYMVSNNPTKPSEPTNLNLPNTEQSNGNDPKMTGEGAITKGTPSTDKIAPTDPKQKPTITAPVNTGEKPESDLPKEIKTYSINLFLNDGAKLKIDDKAITGSGTMKVDLTLGEHKFEITEGNERCVQRHEITKTTKRLTLTCNN